jgi:hypothetical protein
MDGRLISGRENVKAGRNNGAGLCGSGFTTLKVELAKSSGPLGERSLDSYRPISLSLSLSLNSSNDGNRSGRRLNYGSHAAVRKYATDVRKSMTFSWYWITLECIHRNCNRRRDFF